MSPLEFFTQFLKHAEFSRKSRVVLFAYYLRQHVGATEFTILDVKRCFKEALLKEPTDLSALISALCKGKEAPLLKLKAGKYALSLFGVNEVEAVLPAPKPGSVIASSFLAAALPFLQRTIAKVTDPKRQEFLAEAISCLEVGARRATIILSWIAALDHMYDYVLTHHLVAFNATLKAHPGKLGKLSVSKKDDFGDMKEAEFITISRSAGVITNDVRKLMEEKLGFRNSCAHASSIAVGDSKVLSFVEDLVDNIIAKHVI